MNMNKALQNLYHAVSDETTTKVNISKLLVDIHYAITGKESENKNNWSKIVNSMADNWPEGGGGSSDFSTATVTFVQTSKDSDGGGGWTDITTIQSDDKLTWIADFDTMYNVSPTHTQEVVLYKGHAIGVAGGMDMNVSGNATYNSETEEIDITGDCTISYVGGQYI